MGREIVYTIEWTTEQWEGMNYHRKHQHRQNSKKSCCTKGARHRRKCAGVENSKPGNSRQCVVQWYMHSWLNYKEKQETGSHQIQDRGWRRGRRGAVGGWWRGTQEAPGLLAKFYFIITLGSWRGGDDAGVCFGIIKTVHNACSAVFWMRERQEGRKS